MFPKILVPRLPQNSTNINIECAGKSKQLYSLCDQLLRALIYLHFIILILICFQLIMPDVNYIIYGCSSSRTTSRVITNRSFTLEEKHCCSYYSRRVIDCNFKGQIKNRTLYTCRLFLLTRFFQYISNWSKVFELLPTLFLQYTYRVTIFSNFSW